MTEGIKIATIGGGSSYTPELIEGFIKRYEGLPVRELWLVDVEMGREKLEIVGALAKRMVEKAGVPMEIHLTLNREEALAGADFVTTQFRVGGLDARAKDEAIPLKYGCIGQETNGPGGLFKGLRTIPVVLDIIADMKRLCPDAWLINFTNPAGMVTEAVLRYGDFPRFVGLCNGPIGILRGIAKTLEVDPEDIFVQFQGLNHMVFADKVFQGGRDVTDEVIGRMVGAGEGSVRLKNIADTPFVPEFQRVLEAVPIGYLRYYYQTSKMLADCQRAAREEGTRAQVVKKVEHELFELYKDPDLNVKPKQLEERGGAYYSDAACSLIDSIYNDRRDIQTVNTRNNGAILDIDEDSAVEVNCVITAQGPVPLTTGHLPVHINGLIQQIKSFERVASKAAVTGDYDTALLAMTINPLVPSDADAKKMLDELLEAHRDYLPRFFGGEGA